MMPEMKKKMGILADSCTVFIYLTQAAASDFLAEDEESNFQKKATYLPSNNMFPLTYREETEVILQ